MFPPSLCFNSDFFYSHVVVQNQWISVSVNHWGAGVGGVGCTFRVTLDQMNRKPNSPWGLAHKSLERIVFAMIYSHIQTDSYGLTRIA